MKIMIIILACLVLVPMARGVSFPPPVPPPVVDERTAMETLKLHDLMTAHIPPSIPRSWKLISVTSGDRANTCNLWFQDVNGSIYLLQGVFTQNKLVINETVHTIPVR
ncbi:hypothetical protein [Geobacter sp. SVR]|uniref:hypothetical protein n=1 Tax=Geobacter sp. SVR TaxID=2495594 RepID=UPI00143EF6ED|nr:hypothetical protein [Geobacter sp. SVR]BCS52479.1 hypothetical protein GSVR_07870 [Geobacter sp. SVR]GCF84084.1 hypothetical protein GSbR_06840 [Geobacter sp. SVR]